MLLRVQTLWFLTLVVSVGHTKLYVEAVKLKIVMFPAVCRCRKFLSYYVAFHKQLKFVLILLFHIMRLKCLQLMLKMFRITYCLFRGKKHIISLLDYSHNIQVYNVDKLLKS